MIVIPMILQNISFRWVYEHVLGKDPGRAISFAGLLLFFAAMATLRIKKDHTESEIMIPASGGH